MILVVLAVSVLSAVLTRIVSIEFKQGPVKASSLLSFAVGAIFFVFEAIPEQYNAVPAVFFGASFAGMSSEKRITNNYWMALAGLFFGMIYLTTGKFFSGYGGGLGTTACLSVIITLGIIEIIKKAT